MGKIHEFDFLYPLALATLFLGLEMKDVVGKKFMII